MHRFAPVALATLLAASVPALLCAQAPTPFTVPQATGHFTDPANLAGERPRPRDGRELPIDGGLSANGQPDNALGLAQMLRRLNTRASLMLIVAHPDDEDGGMLTYYSRGLGARVAILTLNRGEGGQNQMTGDFEDALGLLRTQELLSADRYMGVTQMFGTEVDFGFTKTKQEAFQKWNHQRVLYDAVRAVRIYRPLIIASTFEGAVTDGHGQHQVSGEIAQEVFKAAGDPSVFPELTKEGILPWQPLKVYARVPFSRVSAQGLYDYATGQTVPAEFTNYVTGQKFTSEPTADVTINEGQTDPLLTYAATDLADLRTKPSNLNEQLSYVQFARIGLGLQRSQIGGGMRMPRPGRSDVSYHLYGSRVCAPNLPNPTPNLCSKTTALTDTPGGGSGAPPSTRSGRVGYRAARDKTPPASPMLISFTRNPKAPTARPITAQGNALGKEANEEPSAESAPYNPALANQPSFFDGIDTSVDGIAILAPHLPMALGAGLHDLGGSISRASSVFEASHSPHSQQNDLSAELQASSLVDALKRADALITGLQTANLPAEEKQNVLHELRIKRVQLNDALAIALNARLDATAPAPNGDIVVGSALAIRVTVSADTKLAPQLFSISVKNDRGQIINADHPLLEPGQRSSTIIDHFARPLPAGGIQESTISIHPEGIGRPTRPYFTRPNSEQPFYNLTDPELRDAPSSPPALTAQAEVLYKEVPVVIAGVVHSGPQPIQIIPPVSLTLDRNAQVIPDGTRSFNVDVRTVTEDHPEGELRLLGHEIWSVGGVGSPRRPLRTGTETFAVSLPPRTLTAPGKLDAVAVLSDHDIYSEGFRAVGYGDLPRTNYYTPATLRVVPVDLKLPPENKRRIAYLPGTGDDVPAALASIGLTPTILKVSDLTPANLAHFDTVVLGVRTYNAHADLHGAPTQALLDFARNGGNVVVQYQTNEFSAADAPYPLELHGERVIDETAPVVLLTTENSQLKTDSQTRFADALLTTPNKITAADFNNWIEERGHGFLDSWDSHYTALTETGDPGAPAEHIPTQAPQRGGLITTQLGKGRWTYVAFALYRQLPEAVPGAFRLFANLLNP